MAKRKIKDPATGAMLRDLRKSKGVKSPLLLAQMMDDRYSVAGILRRESGAIALDFDYVERFCKALNLNEDERLRVLVKAKVSAFKGEGETEEIGKLYFELFEKCYKQSFYAGVHFPIYLWTYDYAEAVLSEYFSIKDVKAAAKNRIKNGTEARENKSKRTRIVVNELALYQPHGSPSVMIDQLGFLLTLEEAPHFEFRILPSDVFLNVLTTHIFVTIDDSYAYTESIFDTSTSEEPATIEMLNDNFERIWTNSYIGIKRNKLIEKAIEHFKAML